MSQFRNVTDQELVIGYGLTIAKTVQPGDVFNVVDGADPSYECQPNVFQPVNNPIPTLIQSDETSSDATTEEQ